jgi:predicted alpha/beta superfamily hydrolase
MKRLLTFLFLFFLSGIFAQKQVDHVINSKVFGHERKITVYLPVEYSLDSLGKFPVAYLFDGQFDPYLKMVSGMMEYYSQTNLCLSLVIVAVHTEDRFEEFVPEPKTDLNNKTTYSTKLTESLEQEVFAFVNENYRTTDFKLGIGHSLGGTFLLYEAFKENSPFGAIIAASPNTNLNEMTKMIPEYLQTHPQLTTFFYVTGGDTDQMELDFLKTTMQIDSAITARKSEFPDWNFQQYEHANHMETFPKTFNDGYLLFQEKWKITTNDLVSMKGLQDSLLELEIKKCLHRKSITRRSEIPYSFKTVVNDVQAAAELNNDYRTAFNISTLSLRLLETDSGISQKGKDNLTAKFKEKREYYNFNEICNTALNASNRKDYKLAAQEYLRAFETGLIRGTFYQRINCLTAFAQTGNTEEAFKQIELLANTYELRGSGALTGNPLLSPLHKDKRWKKYVKILDENSLKGWE